MRICLFDTQDDSLHSLRAEDLPFGEVEQKRLLSLKNPQRLRESLGALLSLRALLESSEIPPIRRDPNGKPYFDAPSAPSFSLSHTHRLCAALLASPQVGQVGLDLELLRPFPHAKAVGERFFSPAEWDQFRASEFSELVFFRLWTQKEARAKMRGTGLLAPSEASLFERTYRLRYEGEDYILSFTAERQTDEPQWQICGKELTYERINEI